MIRLLPWVISLAFLMPADAHVGSIVTTIFELPTEDLPDIHDGSLDDWEDSMSSIAFTHLDFAPQLSVGDDGVDPADLAYRIFLAWHDKGNHLYAAIERVDDAYINTYPGGDPGRLFEFDGIELMVDGDHSGGRYARFGVSDEEEKDLKNFQAQQYFAIAESPDNNTLGYAGFGTDWAVFPHSLTPAATATAASLRTRRSSSSTSHPGTNSTGAGQIPANQVTLPRGRSSAFRSRFPTSTGGASVV